MEDGFASYGYLNIAYFDQEIKGFQSNTFIGTGFVLANAGSQSADGFEFDLMISPIESIDLAISGLIMDPIYDSFPASAAGDLSGTVPSNIPEETFSTTATWNWSRGQYDGYIRFSHLYSSKVKLSENPEWQALLDTKGNGRRKQDTLNFSAGVERGAFSLALWGKNINDDEFLTTIFPAVADPTSTSFFGYPNAFKSYGLTLNYTF